MHTMTDNITNPHRRPIEPVPGDRQVKRAPPPKVKENLWDDEPTWPDGEHDDEVIADGMCDEDDDDPPSPGLPAPLAFRQSLLWNEAIAQIRASKSRGNI